VAPVFTNALRFPDIKLKRAGSVQAALAGAGSAAARKPEAAPRMNPNRKRRFFQMTNKRESPE